MAANLGTRWGMSLRFILSGSITLISQWAIMLYLIVIEVRSWSCYDVISASSDSAGGGHNLLNGPFYKLHFRFLLSAAHRIRTFAAHVLSAQSRLNTHSLSAPRSWTALSGCWRVVYFSLSSSVLMGRAVVREFTTSELSRTTGITHPVEKTS